MRSMLFFCLKTFRVFVLAALLAPVSLWAAQSLPSEEASKLLPNTIGNFKAIAAAIPFDQQSADKVGPFGVTSAAIRSYQPKNGERVWVTLVVTRSESS